jgi:hypothetical protein
MHKLVESPAKVALAEPRQGLPDCVDIAEKPALAILARLAQATSTTIITITTSTTAGNVSSSDDSPVMEPSKACFSEVVRNRPDLTAMVIGQVLAALTDNVPTVPGGPFEFPPGTGPSISIVEFLSRIGARSHASSEALLLALAIVDRVLLRNAAVLRATATNVYRLYTGALVVAVKLHDDLFYRLDHYSRAMGLPTEELCVHERAVLAMTQFQLTVSSNEFDCYARCCETLVKAAVNEADLAFSQLMCGLPNFDFASMQQS